MRAVPVDLARAVADREAHPVGAGLLGRDIERGAAGGRDDAGGGVVEHAHRRERQLPRRSGDVRGDIDRETRTHRVDDGEGLDLQARLRRDADRQRLRRDRPTGIGDGDLELDELRRARPVVRVLVDDLAGGGSRHHTHPGGILDREQEQRIAVGIDPTGQHRNRHRAARRDLGRRPLGQASDAPTPLRCGVRRVRFDGDRNRRRLGSETVDGRTVGDAVRERSRAARAVGDPDGEPLTAVDDRDLAKPWVKPGD